jgi:hypothetical protein
MTDAMDAPVLVGVEIGVETEGDEGLAIGLSTCLDSAGFGTALSTFAGAAGGFAAWGCAA